MCKSLCRAFWWILWGWKYCSQFTEEKQAQMLSNRSKDSVSECWSWGSGAMLTDCTSKSTLIRQSENWRHVYMNTMIDQISNLHLRRGPAEQLCSDVFEKNPFVSVGKWNLICVWSCVSGLVMMINQLKFQADWQCSKRRQVHLGGEDVPLGWAPPP